MQCNVSQRRWLDRFTLPPSSPATHGPRAGAVRGGAGHTAMCRWRDSSSSSVALSASTSVRPKRVDGARIGIRAVLRKAAAELEERRAVEIEKALVDVVSDRSKHAQRRCLWLCCLHRRHPRPPTPKSKQLHITCRRLSDCWSARTEDGGLSGRWLAVVAPRQYEAVVRLAVACGRSGSQ